MPLKVLRISRRELKSRKLKHITGLQKTSGEYIKECIKFYSSLLLYSVYTVNILINSNLSTNDHDNDSQKKKKKMVAACLPLKKPTWFHVVCYFLAKLKRLGLMLSSWISIVPTSAPSVQFIDSFSNSFIICKRKGGKV